MTAEVVDDLHLNNIIRQTGITGLSCRIATAENQLLDLQTFLEHLVKQNEIKPAPINIENSLLSQLAEEALADANIGEDTYINHSISVMVNDCRANDCRIDQLEQSVSQLATTLGLSNDNIDRLCFTEVFGQGLAIAADQLQSKLADVVLIIVIDMQSAAALVFQRRDEIVAKNGRIYAVPALLHENKLNNHNNHYHALRNIYSQTKSQDNSVGLLTISAPDALKIKFHINTLSQCFRHSKPASCSLRVSVADSQSEATTNVVMPLIETIFSLQQKVLLPAISLPSLIESNILSDLTNSPFYLNNTLRPWFYPQIQKQLALFSPTLPDQVDSNNLRRAAFNYINLDGNLCHLILEEFADAHESKRQNFKATWESELFTFYAEDKQQLFDHVQTVKKYLTENSTSNLEDLAFTINSWASRKIDKMLTSNYTHDKSSGFSELSPLSNHPVRAAFVSTSIEDFQSKLIQLSQYCLNSKDASDLYWNDHSIIGKEIAQGKLAFVLPGLGAAYPDMLTELCLHFPEVRAIFDFVDYVAVSAGSQIKPSDRIFPRRHQYAKSSTETPASLAMMDSAVITVLMAEWAIFTLLLNLGITPDILLGCSTGEFAAITMSGAIDILAAAPLFYHLSTGISKALPFNRMVNLRSLKINSALASVEKYFKQYEGTVYLSADLSYEQLLVTGDKDSINGLAKTLEDNNISADFLPFAIPYHTALVSDIVSPQDPDLLALQIDKPLIESWSCSLVDKYPSDVDTIRKISTELFSKPILFRDSIEALYTNGVRKFVEVGPRGNLAPIISETLKSNPHISIAANRADRSAITQLNHTLAALFVNDTYIDLSYLYSRRSPESLHIFDNSTDKVHTYQPVDPELAENKLQEARDTYNIDDFGSIDDFRHQLMQLEQQTITLLESNQCMTLPEERRHPINAPAGIYLSEEVSLPQIFSQFTEGWFSDIVCRQISENQLSLDNEIISKQADYFLLPSEWKTFQSFQQLPKRRQWLAGRIAVKEAVRNLLHNIYGVELANREIEIGIQTSGKIFVNKIHSDVPSPVISLTHKNSSVLAIAADSAIYSAIGIDLESTDLSDDDLSNLVLSQQEQNYIQNLSQKESNLNFKKIWSAKEAAAKVLGLGLPDYLKNLAIVETNKEMNHFSIEAPAPRHLTGIPTHGYSFTQSIETSTLKMSAYVTNLQNAVLAISFLLTSIA